MSPDSSIIMRKFLPILAALLALPGLTAAQTQTYAGEVTVAFGWVKKADGTKVDISGMKLPYRAHKISAKKSKIVSNGLENPSNGLAPIKSPFQQILTNLEPDNPKDSSDITVYQANAGTGYSTFPGVPSSLDDVNMISAGLNKPWTTLTFAMSYTGSFSPYVIRWRCFGSNIDNPAGQSDFTGEFADFGVNWTQNLGEGSHLVEISIAQAAVSTGDSTIFVAQQFRRPNLVGFPPAENGEGAFDGSVDNVFNNAADPTVGSSVNQFWYDWDPVPDGIYENTEIDVFEAGFANQVLAIKVAGSGSVTPLSAANARTGIGRFVSGNLISVLTAGDNNQFIINETITGDRQSPSGTIEVDFIQTAAEITGIRINGTASVSINGTDQWLDLYNFTTNQWVQMASMPGIPLGLNTFNEAYGGTVGYSNFTGTVNHPFFGPIPVIRARVRFKNTNNNISRNWQMRLDHMQCQITTP